MNGVRSGSNVGVGMARPPRGEGKDIDGSEAGIVSKRITVGFFLFFWVRFVFRNIYLVKGTGDGLVGALELCFICVRAKTGLLHKRMSVVNQAPYPMGESLDKRRGGKVQPPLDLRRDMFRF